MGTPPATRADRYEDITTRVQYIPTGLKRKRHRVIQVQMQVKVCVVLTR